MGKASVQPADCADDVIPRASSPNSDYRYDLSHLAPIDRIPVELLIEIFALCTGDDAPLIPLVLGEVRRAWHSIVYSVPDLWRRVSLDDHQRSIAASHAQAALWLEHSGSQPLDIHIRLAHVDSLLPLLIPFFPHVRRCRTCEITGKVEEKIEFSRLVDDPSQADLYHLGITLKGEMELEDGELTSRAPTLSQYPPYLSSRGPGLFNKLCMRVTMMGLPPKRRMSSLVIRSLTIMENSLEVTPDPVRFIEFLTFCPMLEELRFSGYPHEPCPSHRRIHIPIAPLLHLHTLIIRSTCAVRAVLSHIHTPALTSLYLEHTNMEFELLHSDAYVVDAEEGDSEDEAHDFSQSPFSDHGTGMGLRSLIKRSRPPLEVLDMNYADMRTKDFRWCFEHLDTLREFRIVASDMSDKVVSLLAPYPLEPVVRYDVATDEYRAEQERVEEYNDASYRVRMPRLTTLELHNCHRLTGDTVVRAIGARAQYTDRFADGEACRRMRRVTVVGCEGFQPRHIMSLLPTLGARLRTTMA